MAEKIDDLTIRYEEDGVVIVDELDKVVLSRAAWSTIVFRYRQWNKGKEEYSDDRYSIRRYRKVKGQYMQQSKFNISSAAQAEKLIEALQGWIDKPQE
ncbi:MAG TPA: hypothetical protein ENN07_01345 [candidate division Zixibacteria bacterium]|nr:hypothetical protein [candidate division Zixibacteria bacterium]